MHLLNEAYHWYKHHIFWQMTQRFWIKISIFCAHTKITTLATMLRQPWFHIQHSEYFIQYLIQSVKEHCLSVKDRCQHTVTFSKSASEEVGDRGLMGLREGELPTLETYSGSGTYRTCKHNPCLYLHRHWLCANTYHTSTHTHKDTDREESLTQPQSLEECNMKSCEQPHAIDRVNRQKEVRVN